MKSLTKKPKRFTRMCIGIAALVTLAGELID